MDLTKNTTHLDGGVSYNHTNSDDQENEPQDASVRKSKSTDRPTSTLEPQQHNEKNYNISAEENLLMNNAKKKELEKSLSDWSLQRELKKEEDKRKRAMRALNMTPTSDSSLLQQHLSKMERRQKWLTSFQNLDPRFQILKYYEEVALHGGALVDPLAPSPPMTLLRGFAKAAAFTVWRPTSREAISKMMKGEANGKGLDVKGKSAKCGMLSGLIPFLQIHKNEDKKKAAWPPSCGRMRIFYKDVKLRMVAEEVLNSTMSIMQEKYTKAQSTLSLTCDDGVSEAENENAMENMSLKVDEACILQLNESGIGLDVPQRVFFEVYIKSQDITRDGSKYETGRPSEPAFQSMNFACTRKYKGTGPRAVVLQTCSSEALRPQSLVIAYEENQRVTPVASDFDCFTLGTRGVVYDSPLPDDQKVLIKWLVDEIEKILENPEEKSWTSRWLEVLKTNAVKGFTPTVPEYGFGDPKSYDIVKGAVCRLVHNKNGSVRHGAECFNYGFPQELDSEFLVISDTLPGKVPWKYVNGDKLKDILCEKIDEGFCFPLNPKWILADKGWKKVYDKLLASKDHDIQRSLDSWYPRESGIREQIEAVHGRYPNGFETVGNVVVKTEMEGMEAMDLAEDQLRRYLILRRAKMKMRAALMFGKLGGKVVRKATVEDKQASLIKENKISLKDKLRRSLNNMSVVTQLKVWFSKRRGSMILDSSARTD